MTNIFVALKIFSKSSPIHTRALRAMELAGLTLPIKFIQCFTMVDQSWKQLLKKDIKRCLA